MGLKHQIKAAVPPVVRRQVRYKYHQAKQLRGGTHWSQQLAPGHPYAPHVAAASAYSRQRSVESGKPIHDNNRYIMLRLVLDLVRQCSEGDYAEVGTYRGMVAAILWEGRVPGNEFYCFDTFEGFTDVDLAAEADSLSAAGTRDRFADTSLQHVREFITNGVDDTDLKFRVGFFPDTFSGLEDHRFRLVHLDCDLYNPIKAGLETFWPRMVEGGAILVHDYFSAQYPRAQEAVDEFFVPRGITPIPMQDRLGTALVIKQRGMS